MADTIAAVATAYGEGGIGIIRISGEDSLRILREVFTPACGKIVSRRLTYGHIVEKETGRTVDEVLAVYMKAPTTYTGEDVAEIHCHGSVAALRQTLEIVLREGAEPAEPGEFTKRAFLNGRIDLSQAEAVMDMVRAKTDTGLDVACTQLEGKLSAAVRELRQALLDLQVELAVNIDYPDEDIEEIVYEDFAARTSQIGDMIEKLLSTAHAGRIIREGLRVAIIGKPNVGKSSLMNELLGESRTIVTEIPGTTRDTIEEAINIRGIPVYLVDTAGIRRTEDVVEQIGIERSVDAAERADLLIFIVDGSQSLTEEDEEIARLAASRPCLILVNKKDKGSVVDGSALADRLPGARVIATSLIDGEGVEELRDQIEGMVYEGQASQRSSLMVTNVRHADLLRRSLSEVREAEELVRQGMALDFIEVDIRSAYELLGEIIGETAGEDVLDEVFSRFCLGK